MNDILKWLATNLFVDPISFDVLDELSSLFFFDFVLFFRCYLIEEVFVFLISL